MRRTSNTYTVPIYLHEDLAGRGGGWHRTTPIFGSLSQQAAKVSHMFRFEASLCQVCPIKSDLNFNGHDVYSTHTQTNLCATRASSMKYSAFLTTYFLQVKLQLGENIGRKEEALTAGNSHLKFIKKSANSEKLQLMYIGRATLEVDSFKILPRNILIV